GRRLLGRRWKVTRSLCLLARPALQETLHDPVLERVKAHDRQPSSRPQNALGGFKPPLQLPKFVIYIKAERLEGARGGVFGVVMTAAQNAAHNIGQLPRTFERRILPV